MSCNETEKMEENKELQKEQAEWEKEAKRIEQRREECKAVEEEQLNLKYKEKYSNLQIQEEKDLSNIQDEIKKLEEYKISLEKQIDSLGLFAIAKKKSIRGEIEQIEQKINAYIREDVEIHSKYKKKEMDLEKLREKEYKKICEKIDRENEIPISPVERENCKIREKDKLLILEVLAEIDQGAISEIQRANDQLAEYSNQYVSSLLKELVEEDRVGRITQRHKVIFTSLGSYICESSSSEFEDRRALLKQKAEDKELIVAVLERIGEGTLSEIQREDEQLAEYSMQKVYSLLNLLEEDGIIREKMVERKRIYEFIE